MTLVVCNLNCYINRSIYVYLVNCTSRYLNKYFKLKMKKKSFKQQQEVEPMDVQHSIETVLQNPNRLP
jgi:hypothetical protein